MYFWQGFFLYLAPGGLLLAAALTSFQHEGLARWLFGINWLLPPALGLVAVFFGWRFNRSRLLFGVLVIMVADLLLRRYGGSAQIDQLLARYVFHMALLLLPLNLLLFSFWRERGIVTGQGLRRFVGILVQPLLLLGLYGVRGPLIVRQLEGMTVSLPLVGGVFFPALVVSVLVVVGLSFRFWRYGDLLDHGFLWAMVCSFFALLIGNSSKQTFLFSVAVLILIVAAIEAAHRMAFRDELTGLPARRALNEAMLKLGRTYTVAMVDIDFFKKFNDRYGHDVGDQVLAMVATMLTKVGGGGKPFRYGGEEFTILFPGKNTKEAQPHLEALRQAVAEAGFKVRSAGRAGKSQSNRKQGGDSGKKVSLTISIGLAQGDTARKTISQSVIKAADKALYRAKEGGRNRVSC
ncbi:GGDEF domain-containing protein [Thiovibrio frasassiensis]|uniref:diguanylate cyclase n=1 Tax=Thiovibrio frasassiensis TaxID=2984131 RepID=A0A9X4MFF1_9BACT|nr:GGDEF domain-containing protein [Thiovibrio frasassiensis]MDG4475000.1 GGDEF domain-containing protein [Thiovibrio frasassiensis]